MSLKGREFLRWWRRSHRFGSFTGDRLSHAWPFSGVADDGLLLMELDVRTAATAASRNCEFRLDLLVATGGAANHHLVARRFQVGHRSVSVREVIGLSGSAFGADQRALLGSRGVAFAFLTTAGGKGRGADRRLTNEDRASFHREGLGLDVANDFGAGLQLDALSHGDVAVNFAVNDDRAGLDFGLDAGVFANGKAAIRLDFAFDTTINQEVVGELYGALDFNV